MAVPAPLPERIGGAIDNPSLMDHLMGEVRMAEHRRRRKVRDLKAVMCHMAYQGWRLKRQGQTFKDTVPWGRADKQREILKAQRMISGLNHRRTQHVRPEARAIFLAYGFLRGRTRRQVENQPKTAPNWHLVEHYVRTYGWDDQRDLMQRFQQWVDEAGLSAGVSERGA